MPGKTAPVNSTRLHDHSDPKDPKHEEWVVDEADDESFPASDPSTATQPKPSPKRD